MLKKVILSVCFLAAALLTTAQQQDNNVWKNYNQKLLQQLTQKQKPTSIKQELESYQPTAAKSNDTVFITEADLPFSAKTRVGLSPYYVLALEDSAKISVMLNTKNAYSSALMVDENQVDIEAMTLVMDLAPGKTVYRPVANYSDAVGLDCELVIDTIAESSLMVGIDGLPVDTVETLPFAKAQTEPAEVKYLYYTTQDMGSASYDLYEPVATRAFYIERAAEAPYCHINASDKLMSFDGSYPGSLDYAFANVNPGTKNLYLVRSLDGTYTFDVTEGKLPYITTEYGIEEFTPITLPYSYCGEYSAMYGMNPYTAYSFELTDSAKIYLTTNFSNYVQLSDENGDIYLNNYLSQYVLPAGKYYVLVLNYYGMNDDYCIKIEERPASATSGVVSYDSLAYNKTITVGKPEYGSLGVTNPMADVNGYEYFAESFKVELTPGYYRVASTVKGMAGQNKQVGLSLLSQLTGTYSDDVIRNSINYGSTDSKLNHEFNFVVYSACTYYICLFGLSLEPSMNYELVVEKVKDFTELTIPCRINGTVTPTDEVYNASVGNYTVDKFYSLYIPQDTILKIKATSVVNKSGAPIVLFFDKGDRLPYQEVELFNGEIEFVDLSAGWWSLAAINVYPVEDISYDVAINYSVTPEAVADTITLMQLLANAPLVESVANDSIFLGYQPSSLVDDIEDEMRYAIAYKLQLDSAESVVVKRTPAFDDELFFYRAKGDSVEFVDDLDGEYPYLLTADSTCAYYVVFSSYSAKSEGYVCDISIQPISAGNTHSLAEVIGMAKDITLPYHEEGTLGDVLCSDLNTYVKAYRVHLDSGDVFHYTVKNVSLLYNAWPAMYLYAQDTTEINHEESSLLDICFIADSTAYYYLVVTTDYDLSPGDFVFDAELIEQKSFEQQLADATLLEGKGTRTDNMYYMPENNMMCHFYKMPLDSGQVVYFKPENSSNLTAFRAVGDTIESVSMFDGYFFAADSATTYYVAIASGYATRTFNYAITPKALPTHDVEGLHFTHSGVLDFENSEFAWFSNYSVPAYSSDSYRFAMAKDEYAILIQRDHIDADASSVIFEGNPVNKNFAKSYQSPADSTYEVSVMAVMGYGRPVSYDLMLQRAELLDSILAHAPAMTMDQFPYTVSETRKQNFERKRVLIASTKAFNQVAAFKVDMKLGEQLSFTSPKDVKLFYAAFTKDDYGFNSKSANSLSTLARRFTANASDTYYFVVYTNMPIDVNVFDQMDDVLALNVTNPNVVAEVVRLEADCKAVEATDYNSEVSVRMALGEIQLIATTENGGMVEITNNPNAWVLNGNMSQATYNGKLPKGFVLTADATMPKILVNPATITYSASGNGTITYSGDNIVERNTNVTFNITAVDNYHFIDTIMVNGAAIESSIIGTRGGELQLTADSNIDVKAIFKKVPVVTVSYSAGENGSITYADSNVVILNAFVTFNITADDNYVIDTIMVNGRAFECDIIGKASGTLELSATCDITVEVSFKSTKTDNGVAIDNTEVEKAVVYTQQRTLYIEGATLGANITVYSTTGSVIYTSEATSTLETIALPSAGMYIIHIDNQIEKVVCQ